MPTSVKAIHAGRIRHGDWVGAGLLDADPELRFEALANESTRRRIARFGEELVRLGEVLQDMAAPGRPLPRSIRSSRRLH